MNQDRPVSAEKRLLFFLLISFGVLFLYSSVFTPKKTPPTPEPSPAAVGSGTEAGSGAPPPVPLEAGGGDVSGRAPLSPVAPAAGIETVVEQPEIRWVLDSWGAGVKGARLKGYADQPGADLADPAHWYPALSDFSSDGRTLAPDARRSLALRVLTADGVVDGSLPADRVLWERTEASADRVVYRLPLAEAGLALTKTFRFPAVAPGTENGPFHLLVAVGCEVTDPARQAESGRKSFRVRLTGPAGMPVEPFTTGVTVIGAALLVDTVSVEEFSPPGRATAAPEVFPKPDKQGADRLIEWAGMHSRFFGGVLKPLDPRAAAVRQAVFEPIRDREPQGKEVVNLAPALDFDLPAGESREFLFYVGPMDPKLFRDGEYAPFAPIIDYGLFGFIAKALVILLGVLRSATGSWGLAIIALTLIVRLALFPLSRRSQVSMQKQGRQMARLKPKVDVLRERYGKNKKKMQEEMMKLYREEGVRIFPMGCLILFLQLPIFIGLFQALRYSIGLRHSSFLWASDLTAPDRLCRFVGDLGIIDLTWLNVFPLAMAVTWYLSSAMAPKPADPQQAQTAKIMRVMTIFFSLLLYNYPAGLALYMVVSSTWSIFESRLVRKLIAAQEPPASPVAATFRKGK
ncbi:MAG: membrane protein insertase YidC [Planctomycetes bacterium]|jgi:YidC/Oxa1 family membrane protein insertase|nr:membrane protein insertase YidC [Planctomycetota bacterium]